MNVLPSGKVFRVVKFFVLAVFVCAIAIAVNFCSFPNSDRFYIAILAPTTGPSANSGEEMVRGAQMYIDRVNQNGGDSGQKSGTGRIRR